MPEIAEPHKHHYVILRTHDGATLYSGPNETRAARRLDPGTVYGTGKTHDAAAKTANTARNAAQVYFFNLTTRSKP